MTTLVLPIDFGPLAVHSTWLVICVTVGYLCRFSGRVKADRHWTLDLQKKNSAAWQANFGLALGDPVVISRVDAEQTVYKRRMWREDGFSWSEAA